MGEPSRHRSALYHHLNRRARKSDPTSSTTCSGMSEITVNTTMDSSWELLLVEMRLQRALLKHLAKVIEHQNRMMDSHDEVMRRWVLWLLYLEQLGARFRNFPSRAFEVFRNFWLFILVVFLAALGIYGHTVCVHHRP